ncbi:unnamed protein product [Enterobius vermicularis]|uniref:Innexin n=1 Tax=Enterobius vermicularis TaxID=51028 RepID=A0A0N4VHQ9_ENTVE|nr:unnamed protein product [Enterobius vermicularis]
MFAEVSDYLKRLKASHDEDAVDRINYVYTSSLLLIFSLLLTAKQYVGEPLQCWVPHQFKEGWEKYVEKHCFIENTYYTKIDERIPDSAQERQDRELAYYQWLPIILIIEAASCYAPRIVWKLFNKNSGLNLTSFIPLSMLTTKGSRVKDLKLKDNVTAPLVEHFQRNIRLAHQNKSIKFGRYVTLLYLFVKIGFVINVILQFVLLDRFLGPQYTLWGIGIVNDLVHGRHWKESGHFPRVTLCDVKVREMGNIHNWTVQCVLMVNMFAEKIFVFLWFWFLFIGIITILNFIYWLYVTLLPSQGISFVRKYLKNSKELNRVMFQEFNNVKVQNDNQISNFIDDSLRTDGLTILRLISDNSGDLAVADIISRLWENAHPKQPSQNPSLGKFLNKLNPKYDDDAIDRCNYLITNTILIFCALTVAAKQYVGEPLQCWVPAEFKAGWEKYIENYCFVENTYFVRMDDDLPAQTNLRNEKEIHYYQWVPFILIFQALLFMIPRLVWKTFNKYTGMNIFALIETVSTTSKQGQKRVLNKSIWRVYVTDLYIFCKMLNLINICIQFAFLNCFLGPQYKFWGFGILSDLLNGRQWYESGHFPRVTFCDISVREIGNVNQKTVQCVLMINMFNEKIFLGIWFWLFLLGILTSINLLYWIITTAMPQYGRNFVKNSLDSITVLRLLSDNAGELVAADVVACLWRSRDNTKEDDQSIKF